MQSVSCAEALAEELLCAREYAPNTGRFVLTGCAKHRQHDCAAEHIGSASACKLNRHELTGLTPRLSDFADYEADIRGKRLIRITVTVQAVHVSTTRDPSLRQPHPIDLVLCQPLS